MSGGACPDCGVAVGQPHEGPCDVARCLWTGTQRIQCGLGLIAECCRALRTGNLELADALAHYESLDDLDHDCGQEKWTGEWPGEDDARRLGFWTYWSSTGWQDCSRTYPGARPDLNKLGHPSYTRWDRDRQRWERAEQAA